MSQITFSLPTKGVDYTKLFEVFKEIGLDTVEFSFRNLNFSPSTAPPRELDPDEEDSVVEQEKEQPLPEAQPKITPVEEVAPEIASGENTGFGDYPEEGNVSMDIEDWEIDDLTKVLVEEERKDTLDIFARRISRISDEEREKLENEIKGHQDFFSWK